MPVHRPAVGGFVKIDQEGAVALAEEVVRGAGQDLVAQRLRPRPFGARRASFNRNTCTGCGVQPDWHDFEAVVEPSIYEGRRVVRGRAGGARPLPPERRLGKDLPGARGRRAVIHGKELSYPWGKIALW